MRRLAWAATVCSLLAAAQQSSLAADEPPAAGQALITTANDEQISGPLSKVEDGKLTLATEPPRVLDLADIDRIELGKQATTPSGDVIWIGQDNHDLVQVGGAPGGNGIQDLHLRATSLKPLALKQVMVVCRFPKQLRVWRLDTSQSPHWRLAVARDEVKPEADFYLEPTGDDSSGLSFDVTFTYADDSTSKSKVVATTHTSDQLKVNRSQEPGQPPTTNVQPTAASKAETFLIDAGRLRGDVVGLDAESLVLRTSWKTEIRLPLVRASGVWFGNVGPAGSRGDFDKQLAAPGAEDIVFLVAPDKTAAQISGSVAGLSDGKLNIRFEGADRSIKQDRVLGVVFAAHPKIAPPDGVSQTLVLKTGDTISGRWVGLKDDTVELEMPWQARVSVPLAELSEIRGRNGKVVYLSDLEPSAVEEVGYFGRVIHWRRNQGFDDKPPTVKGRQPANLVAMHSRCVLTYPLDQQFDKFKATLAFDDSAGGRGRVLCRVMVDGREVFSQPDVRADADPQTVDVSTAGGKQLTLEVDFGQGEDVGDRVLWTEPRLFRSEGK
jgi:hypothetical protein